MLQEKVDRIVSVLPHGSGINYDYEGFLQAEKLSARQVYKIAGRKFELQRVYNSNYYRICSTLKTE